jgi:hypothetical protein
MYRGDMRTKRSGRVAAVGCGDGHTAPPIYRKKGVGIPNGIQSSTDKPTTDKPDPCKPARFLEFL